MIFMKDGYSVFRIDRPKRGEGIAIYTKQRFQVEVLLSRLVAKQFEFLSLTLKFSKSLGSTVIGYYRPPSADIDALKLLSDYTFNELTVLGDLNLNWLQPVCDDFRSYCDFLNIFQLVDKPM